MRPMIFDTQGTGFYKDAVRQMMNQPEISFLGEAGGGSGLGDEIMLLEGLDDLAAAYPHGYDDGPARNYTMPTMDRGTTYDFAAGPVEVGGMDGSRLGASVNSNQGAWPRRADPLYRYTGLGNQPGWPARKPRFARSADRTAMSGLGSGLGNAQQNDARTAMMIANTTKSLGLAACGFITNAGDQRTCTAGINAAFEASRMAIVAGYGTDGTYPPPGGTPVATPEVQALIEEKLRLNAERSGVDPNAVGLGGDGISTQTLMIGGIVVAGLLGVFLIM